MMPTDEIATKIFCLKSAYSTTRQVSQVPPVVAKTHDSDSLPRLFLAESVGRKAEGGLRTKGYFKVTQKRPLITIITVVFNGEVGLENAILSVINQTYDNVEFIVIDGGSADGTVDIIKRHDLEIDYWVSEKDNGIFDAMNKGVSVAQGEWILFLGSDDYLINDSVLSEFICKLLQLSEADPQKKPSLVFGDVVYSNGYYFKSKLDYRLLLHNTVHHQAALYNKALFKSFRYNSAFKTVADYELNLLIYVNKIKTFYIGKPMSFCTYGGVSSDIKSRTRSISELNSIRKIHVNLVVHVFMCAILMCKTFVRTKFLWK